MKIFGERPIFGMSQREVLAILVIGVVGAAVAIVSVDRFLERKHRVSPAMQKMIDDRVEQVKKLRQAATTQAQ